MRNFNGDLERFLHAMTAEAQPDQRLPTIREPLVEHNINAMSERAHIRLSSCFSLLSACRKSGHGDYRKIKPVSKEGGPGLGYGAMMMLLVIWSQSGVSTPRLVFQYTGSSNRKRR